MACSHLACSYPQALYRFEWRLSKAPFPHARFLLESADGRVFVEYLRGSLRFSRSLYTESSSAEMRNMDHVNGLLDVYSMDVLVLSLSFSSSDEFLTIPLTILRSFQYGEIQGGVEKSITSITSNSQETVIREYSLRPIRWGDGIFDVIVHNAHVQSVLLGNNVLFAEEHAGFQFPFRLMTALPSSSIDPLSLELKPDGNALSNAFFHHRNSAPVLFPRRDLFRRLPIRGKT